MFGTSKQERAFGPAAARSPLKKWGKLAISIQGPVREVRGKTWGFAQANLALDTKEKYPVRMAGLVIARPDAKGVWQVVVVQYTAL
ncbi:MAG: hypothetical protein JWP01_2694 [Myxococcales bacterium]|nr:hypothetical protein [Myxococcales bacterium]